MERIEYSQAPRYEAIEDANESSWYFTEGRPFEIYISVGTLKPSVRGIGDVALGFRKDLAGNMSPFYGPEELANKHMRAFYESVGLDINRTKLLKPQRPRIEKTPLQMLNVDEVPVAGGDIPTALPERADFLYTYDTETILAARPADCPIVLATAETPKGRVLMLTHFSWEVIADGSMTKMFEHYDALGVDRDSLRIYVTPGAHAEHFPYTNYPKDPSEQYPSSNTLFLNVRPNEQDPSHYDFEVDTPHYVYEQLLSFGVDTKQIYADTSDTSRLDSGYSSHGRAKRSEALANEAPGRETNIRDIIIAKMN